MKHKEVIVEELAEAEQQIAAGPRGPKLLQR